MKETKGKFKVALIKANFKERIELVDTTLSPEPDEKPKVRRMMRHNKRYFVKNVVQAWAVQE